MTEKYLNIHGHFYQPPRQDVLSGEIPVETGTHPYQNWNEKIHAECYRPNAELGNFSRISFNIGPTLLQWMEEYDPEIYHSIIQQENSNYQKYGVGNGMAQAYNHTILPLATRMDKITQLEWGIADFIHRFGHHPAGLWLPETAVDLVSLKLMAERGIQYTILAPWQADAQRLDVRKPYWVKLGNGLSLAVFFYQMDISTRLSFDPASTVNADQFLLQYILPNFTNGRSQLKEVITLASDGELYGHHQPFRDRFLAHLSKNSGSMQGVEVTYPGRILQDFSYLPEIRIRENTSWSCHHGVLRWREECPCTPGASWKSPMRAGLNSIARLLDRAYQKMISEFAGDPLAVRNAYIHVMLNDQPWDDFSKQWFGNKISTVQKERLKALMKAQVARQWMFTSCGWFFDEFDRIEPRNNIGYAAQAVYLTELATEEELFSRSIKAICPVKSERTGLQARNVFEATYLRCIKALNSD